jgi:FkbM family methyltransferase
MNNTIATGNETPEAVWDKVLSHLKGSRYLRERDELMKFPKLLGNARTFVDIGASLGPYTWMAHYHLNGATVHAVEANHHLCRHIEEEWAKVEAAGLARGNKLTITHGAIHDGNGVVSFEIDVENFLNSHIASSEGGPSARGEREIIEARCIRIDDLFPDSDPDLIKLDVEGAEWRALNGGRKLLARGKSTFLVEIHPWGDKEIGKRPSDIFGIFREYGYSVRRYNQHWLFRPGEADFTNRLTSRAYGFVLDHGWIKKLAKKILRS